MKVYCRRQPVKSDRYQPVKSDRYQPVKGDRYQPVNIITLSHHIVITVTDTRKQ